MISFGDIKQKTYPNNDAEKNYIISVNGLAYDVIIDDCDHVTEIDSLKLTDKEYEGVKKFVDALCRLGVSCITGIGVVPCK